MVERRAHGCLKCSCALPAMQFEEGSEVGMKPPRTWQAEAAQALDRERNRSGLCVATPGGGKTAFASQIMRNRVLVEGSIQRVIVVVPTTPLKSHWMRTAHDYEIELDHEFSNAQPVMKWHGAVVTYAQVASFPDLYRRLSADRTLVVLDEPHHCGDEQAWGLAALQAFE